MAKLKCKGTLLQQDLANTFTTVAQVTDISTDGFESESVETDSLDNTAVGIPSTPTGRVKPGNMSCELIYDPGLTGHKAVLAALVAATTESWKIIHTDNSNFAFTSAGMSFGLNVKQGDVLRGSIKMTLADVPTLPIS
mgnify:CR=1 FL=1